MDTYFPYLVDDVWYFLLMAQPPRTLMKIRKNCPYLRERSDRTLFLRDYRARWVDLAEDLYEFVVCRAKHEIPFHRLPQMMELTNLCYDHGDHDSIDWLLDISATHDYTYIFTENQADYLQRIVRLKIDTPAHLCKHRCQTDVKKIQALFPSADYTELYLCTETDKHLRAQLKSGFSYCPNRLLAKVVKDKDPKNLTYLLAKHAYEEDYLYLLTHRTSVISILKQLLTSAMVPRLLQEKNYRLIRPIFLGLIELPLDCLYSAEHFDFLVELLTVSEFCSDDHIVSEIKWNLQPLLSILLLQHPVLASLIQ